MYSLMDRKKPIASQYSLDKLETLVKRDIARIKGQLARMERVELDPVRASTIATYREMIDARETLLLQIREQSEQFNEKAVG
ncbi:hypothetical protein A9Q81_09585 [Gammaproteobacteria bacterium 42_54_T18]|nr:hypothetical protein A9Q81_09585 [Gammaproteobacteria bacterium 42_54_T18]